MDYRIIDNGIETPVTAAEINTLENKGLIYFCPEHACYHVTPDYEDDYRDSTGGFDILRPVPVG